MNLEINNVETFGWEAAIRGMRNSYASWDKSDSYCLPMVSEPGVNEYILGDNDLALASKLAKTGSSHAKFRRMIHVQCDICGPMYWWKEFDTYKVGTVVNSTSTMHSITNKEFETDDFAQDDMMSMHAGMLLLHTVEKLNELRNLHLNQSLPGMKNMYWKDIIRSLPSSYLQLRTVDFNYEVIAKICKEREGHKLPEWAIFISKMKELPYSEELIFCKE